MTTYNRAWLQEQIKGYLHDASVSAYLDTWIDLGAKRIAQTLQCSEMETELVRSAGDAENYLAGDTTLKRVLGVQWQGYSGSYVNLRSVPRHNAGQYKRDGQPAVYLIEDRKIYPLPFNDGNFKAQVLTEVEVPDDSSTNDVLTAYPFIFLNAALAEAYDWKQNQEMMARYEQKWANEAVAVTERYLSERIGDTPAMRAM